MNLMRTTGLLGIDHCMFLISTSSFLAFCFAYPGGLKPDHTTSNATKSDLLPTQMQCFLVHRNVLWRCIMNLFSVLYKFALFCPLIFSFLASSLQQESLPLAEQSIKPSALCSRFIFSSFEFAFMPESSQVSTRTTPRAWRGREVTAIAKR